MNSNQQVNEKPLLVGLLIDVSGTMKKSIKSADGQTNSRMESFKKSFDELIRKAIELCKKPNSDEIVSLVKIFVLGFGFVDIKGLLFGRKQDKIRSLLRRDENGSDVLLVKNIADDWEEHQKHIENISLNMFGDTPIFQALKEAEYIMNSESENIHGSPILFILSDGNNGEPSDSTASELVILADKIKKSGVTILSCYLSDSDATEYKRLHDSKKDKWTNGARLMFDIASKIPTKANVKSYLKEYDWSFGENSHFFTQINQSQALNDFLDIVLSGLKVQEIKENLFNKVDRLVAKSNLEDALSCLLLHFDKDYLDDYKNEIIHLQGRNESNKDLRRKNLINSESYNLERSRLSHSTLELVKKYKENRDWL